MPPVTIKEVAKRAKVSIATVSRVLNSSDKVTQGTREKVLAACKDLGYSPNLQAKRLKLGKTHTIMAVLPFLTLPSIIERLRGVLEAFAASEFDLIPFSVENPQEREIYLASLSNRSRSDGVLIISMPITESQVQRFQDIGMPVVLIDSHHRTLKRIIVDDIAGGEMATDHLLELGHERIAFISDHLDNPLQFSSMADRFQGYRKALEEKQVKFNPQYQKQGKHGREEAKQMALELLNLSIPPTAIVAASDTQAIGVLDAARHMNISVPRQLSVIGYDDIRDADYVNLTTIKQPLYESGLEGGKAILQQIENGLLEPLEIQLPVSLIIRGTTAAPNHG
jgi:DNA-binding LacI/PurR family transcriptional regulator